LEAGSKPNCFLPGNGWFARTEYRYADYGSATLPMLTAAGPISLGGAFPSVRTSPVVQTVRTELSYKFNMGGAPATSYVAAPIAPVNWTGFHIGGGGGVRLVRFSRHGIRYRDQPSA
jgi:outer membrane immunogenic protein